MTKEETIKTVSEMMQADSCCRELKEAAKEWLDAVGTSGEKKAAEALKAEMKEDVCSIDNFIELCSSPTGKKIFGADQAAAMLKAGQEAKGKGGKYCLCGACQAGGKLLDDPSGLNA